MNDKYDALKYACPCGHTAIQHTFIDGCELCDCTRHRNDVIAFGELTKDNNELKRQVARLRKSLEVIRKETYKA